MATHVSSALFGLPPDISALHDVMTLVLDRKINIVTDMKSKMCGKKSGKIILKCLYITRTHMCTHTHI